MASVPGYIYATKGDDVYVNLYAGGTADIETPGGKLKVVQETRYPWDGAVKMTVTPDKARRFALQRPHPRLGAQRAGRRAISIASWIRPTAAATITVNGTTVPMNLDKGYVTINRVVEGRRRHRARICRCRCGAIIAHPKVEADRDRVALQRGPIVYAAEWVDNPERQDPQHRPARRQPADDRVPRRPAQRRPGDQRAVGRIGDNRGGRDHQGPSRTSWRSPTRPGRTAAAAR